MSLAVTTLPQPLAESRKLRPSMRCPNHQSLCGGNQGAHTFAAACCNASHPLSPKVLLLSHWWEWISEESGSGWNVEVPVPLDGQDECPAASLALGTLSLDSPQTRGSETLPRCLRGGSSPERGLMLTAQGWEAGGGGKMVQGEPPPSHPTSLGARWLCTVLPLCSRLEC